MRRRSGLMLILLVAGALLLGGCKADRPAPTVDFTAEQQGQSLVITVESTNFRIPGDGHWHIRLNDGPETMAYSKVYTIPNMTPGTYQIYVELSDLKHNDLGISKSKEIVVK